MGVSCHPQQDSEPSKKILGVTHLVLVGNANVGKSVVFNQLTGMNQTVGNWPGKTVSWAEGEFLFKGRKYNIVDLPGIYSLSTFSMEEIVSREFIVEREPDYIINVIDASNLERNLFFTIQLMLLQKAPLILVLNQWDVACSKGIEIDIESLQELLGIPVIPAVAVHGRGVHEILERIEQLEAGASPQEIPKLRFGKEIEERMKELIEIIKERESIYPPRFAALKLLEQDEEMFRYYGKIDPRIIQTVEQLTGELEEIHGHDSTTIIASEIYSIVHQIITKIVNIKHDLEKRTWAEKLDHITTHSVWGYVVLALILLGAYTFVFTVGGWIADSVDLLYENLSGHLEPWSESVGYKILWQGGLGSFFGALGAVIPLIFLFYFLIEILQDSGYLPRAAFLMDRGMHLIGLHGKTIIPLILGFGCNVPGCTACRILETEREKKISIYITTLVPCAAVTTVVMGLVGRYLGFLWAVSLYGINFLVIIVMGKLAYRNMKGVGTELILELHDFRKPNFNVIVKQTWFRGKEFVYNALPLITILGMFMEILVIFDILAPINQFLSPITVFWLGLPVGVGIFLIYGIARKELTLVLLATYAGSVGLTLPEYLTPIQMIVFALVTMLYIPCLATIIVVGKETGWRFAFIITGVEIAVALLIGGAIHWFYQFWTLENPIFFIIAVIVTISVFLFLWGWSRWRKRGFGTGKTEED